MTHKPPQGIDTGLREALECAEYALSNPASDQQFALAAIRTALSAPPDPRKDLALEAKLEEAKWWYETHIRPWRADDLDMEDVAQKRIAELEQRLAEMRGASR